MDIDLTEMRVESTVSINAAPETVWTAVTAIEKMPQRSEEVQRVEWVSGDEPAVGNVFQGYNKRGDFEWDVPCHIVACEAPSNFAYTIFEPSNPSSTWTYAIEREGDAGSRVTKTFQHGTNISGVKFAIEADPDKRDQIIAGRSAELQSAMDEALQRLKAEAEA